MDKQGDRAFYLLGFWLVCCLGIEAAGNYQVELMMRMGEVRGEEMGESKIHLYFAGVFICSHITRGT